MTETCAAIGAFATFAVAAIMLTAVAVLLITSIKNWLVAKNEIIRTTKSLTAVQTNLIQAHKDLRKHLETLEREVRDD